MELFDKLTTQDIEDTIAVLNDKPLLADDEMQQTIVNTKDKLVKAKAFDTLWKGVLIITDQQGAFTPPAVSQSAIVAGFIAGFLAAKRLIDAQELEKLNG